MAFSLSIHRTKESWDPLNCNHEAESHNASGSPDKKRGSQVCNDLINTEGRPVQSRTRDVGLKIQPKNQKVVRSNFKD